MFRHALAGVVLLLFVRAEIVSAQSTPPTFASTGLALAPGQFAMGAEALLWWFKDSPTPVPLVTDGLVGQPNTQVFLGGGSVNTGANPGFRISAGYGLSERTALEGNVFYIPTRSTTSSVASSGNLDSIDLVIPFFDPINVSESGTYLSLSPVFSGSARTELTNNLLGVELNGAWALAPAGAWQLDAIGGFRYLRLRETYSLTSDSPYIPPFPQDIWITSDNFDTTNHFYGLQAGLRARIDEGSFFAAGTVKVALGAMVQKVNINGSLVTNDYTDYGPTVTYPGGWFALPTSIGSYSHTAFAVVPEVALNLGYRITPSVSLMLGYSFLYASNVVRPGDQINRTLNWTQSVAHTEDPNATLLGPAQPSFQRNDSAFWAQGINLGLAIRF
jgi:hypothetical protein